MHIFKTCVLALLLVLPGACSNTDNSYYPLKQGYWWQYAAIRSIRGEDHLQKLILANLPKQTINGVKLHAQKRADGQVEYFSRRDGGVFKIDPENGNEKQILQEPATIGTKWKADSRILFLKVTGAFEATYNRRIKEAIPMEYEVVSTSETVKVKAGKFRDCIKVAGKGSIYGGGGSLKEFMDIDSINIETEEWYAPGVGLVKRTRKEYTHPVDFENYYQEELESVRMK